MHIRDDSMTTCSNITFQFQIWKFSTVLTPKCLVVKPKVPFFTFAIIVFLVQTFKRTECRNSIFLLTKKLPSKFGQFCSKIEGFCNDCPSRFILEIWSFNPLSMYLGYRTFYSLATVGI